MEIVLVPICLLNFKQNFVFRQATNPRAVAEQGYGYGYRNGYGYGGYGHQGSYGKRSANAEPVMALVMNMTMIEHRYSYGLDYIVHYAAAAEMLLHDRSLLWKRLTLI